MEENVEIEEDELSDEMLNWMTEEEEKMAAWNGDNVRKETKRKNEDAVRGEKPDKRKRKCWRKGGRQCNCQELAYWWR